MADNVGSIFKGDTGDSYDVSTDEGDGGHVQRMKLAMSADGSEEHIPADEFGLYVQPAPVLSTGTINDADETVSLAVRGSTISVLVVLQSVDWDDDGSLELQTSVDGGTNFSEAKIGSVLSNNREPITTEVVADLSSSNSYLVDVSQVTNVRVKCTTYVGGSVDVTLQERTAAPFLQHILPRTDDPFDTGNGDPNYLPGTMSFPMGKVHGFSNTFYHLRSDDTGRLLQSGRYSNNGTALALAAEDAAETLVEGIKSPTYLLDFYDNSFVGTVILEYFNDESSWAEVPANFRYDAETFQPRAAIAGNGTYLIDTRPFMGHPLRVRVNAYTSGSTAAVWTELHEQLPFIVQNDDDGQLQYFRSDSSGNLRVTLRGAGLTDALSVKKGGTTSNSVLVTDDDACSLGQLEDVMIQIEGDSDGDFNPEISLDGTNWNAVHISLFTDITTAAAPAALVNGGIYTLDLTGRIGTFRVRLSGASTGSSTVYISWASVSGVLD